VGEARVPRGRGNGELPRTLLTGIGHAAALGCTVRPERRWSPDALVRIGRPTTKPEAAPR